MIDQSSDSASERPSFSRRLKWSIFFHLALSSLSMLALVVMVNYLAHRHNERFYISQAAAHKLSPLTLQVLNNLTNPVKIVAFFDRREPLFGAVSSMLKEYQARSPMIELEFVDYRMPGRAEVIRNQYRISAGSESSRIIFDSGTQVRSVLGSELSDFSISPEKEIRRTGFKGEQMFTSAILNVTQLKSLVAYFTQGHGEHDPFSDTERSYSRFAELLENNNVIVKALPPLVSGGVPDDCGILIIAGPEQPFDQTEIERIQKYLDGGGRMLVLFSASSLSFLTGLEQLLLHWDVEVGFNWVQDMQQAQAGETAVVLLNNYGVHPLVRPLLRSSLKFVTPRSISHKPAATTADAPKVVELVTTGSDGRAIVPVQGQTWRVSKTGNLPVAAAIERQGIQSIASTRTGARIVVVGDSLFLSNLAFNQAANSDFGNLTFNWLANRDSLLGEIGPSAVSEYQIQLTDRDMSQLRWLFLGALPGSVMIFGFFVWLRRRA